MTGVSWRRALVVLATVAVALIGTIVAIRGNGFSAVDATVPRATRWFVHQPSKRVVLADGFAGKALAALNPETDERLSLVQSPTGVSLLEPDVGVARSIDAAQLRIGPRTTLGLIDRPGTVVGVGQPGLIAVEPGDRDAVRLWTVNVGFYNITMAAGLATGLFLVSRGYLTEGRTLVLFVAAGASGFMATILRTPGDIYGVRYDQVPLSEVANSERTFPKKWIAESGCDVTDEFLDYCTPLVGEEMVSLPMVGGRQRMTRFAPKFADQKLAKYTPQADRT